MKGWWNEENYLQTRTTVTIGVIEHAPDRLSKLDRLLHDKKIASVAKVGVEIILSIAVQQRVVFVVVSLFVTEVLGL